MAARLWLITEFKIDNRFSSLCLSTVKSDSCENEAERNVHSRQSGKTRAKPVFQLQHVTDESVRRSHSRSDPHRMKQRMLTYSSE